MSGLLASCVLGRLQLSPAQCIFSQQGAGHAESFSLGQDSVSADSAEGWGGRAGRGEESGVPAFAKTHTLLAFWQGGAAQ